VTQEPAPCVDPDSWDATGFFRVDKACAGPVLVDPEGKRFLSVGVNDVRFNGDYTPSGKNPYLDAVKAKYGTPEAWAAAEKTRLMGWGFNTIGSWSDVDLFKSDTAFTRTLDLSGADWRTGQTPDYFAETWAAAVAMRADVVSTYASERFLLGWFIDNELHWGPDWRKDSELFEEYLAMPASAPGRATLQAMFVERHPTIADFNDAWGTSFASFDALGQASSLPHPDRQSAAMRADRDAFLEKVADRYFSVTVGAIRARDANHLVLGTRAVGVVTPKKVLEVAGRYLDVVSVNSYEYDLDPALVWPPAQFGFLPIDKDGFLRAHFEASGRPILVSEFGFRARDSGLPNSWPPVYPVLGTQQERADRFAAYVQRCKDAPWVVGYHWYKFQDQPPEGRFDGENNNWGLVGLDDSDWSVLVQRATEVNRDFVARGR
jgi:agarase